MNTIKQKLKFLSFLVIEVEMLMINPNIYFCIGGLFSGVGFPTAGALLFHQHHPNRYMDTIPTGNSQALKLRVHYDYEYDILCRRKANMLSVNWKQNKLT